MSKLAKKVLVKHVEADEHSIGWPPTGLLNFKKWLDYQIAGIPEDSLSTATISFDKEYDYYDNYTILVLTITYARPKTKEELAADASKREKARIAAKRKKEKQQENEKKLLEKLKAKYEKA